MYTFIPSCKRILAVVYPIPEVEPEINAVLFFRLRSIWNQLHLVNPKSFSPKEDNCAVLYLVCSQFLGSPGKA